MEPYSSHTILRTPPRRAPPPFSFAKKKTLWASAMPSAVYACSAAAKRNMYVHLLCVCKLRCSVEALEFHLCSKKFLTPLLSVLRQPEDVIPSS